MKCIHCGYVIPAESEFCPYCGSRVVASPPPTPTPESAPAPTVPISDAPEKPREDRERITQAQRYFDPDYGYSAENPMVVSSVPMIGYYLSAFRTEDGQAFTWERQPRKGAPDVDEYQLFLAGKPYKTVYFRTGGNDTDYLPKGIVKDADALQAAKAGITLDELYAKREAKEQKRKRRKARRKKLLLCLLVAIALCTGIYFGVVYGYPYLRYQSAVRNIESNPQKSIEIFDDLGDYKDAVALCPWAHYYWMKNLVSEGDYESAIQEYDYFNSADKQLQDYLNDDGTVAHDADDARADAFTLANTCYQEFAAQAIAEEDYTKALDLLDKVKVKDSSKLRAECYYHLVLQNYEARNWADAASFLDKLTNVDHQNEFDVSEYRYEILYNYATACLEEGTRDSCSKGNNYVTQLIKAYGATDELLNLQAQLTETKNQATYDAAIKKFNDGQYARAALLFWGLGDYKDSYTKWLEAKSRSGA